jgi:probable rRNA maturation factor
MTRSGPTMPERPKTPARQARPALTLSLQFADASHREHLPRHAVARWIRAALEAPAQITVRIVGEAEGRELNRDYRHKDYATNVLTFDYEQEPLVLADLVLCAPVVAAEARRERKPIAAHYAHLLVHGALHAQGYDHEVEADALVMEARESEVLLGLGLPDPYRRRR